MQLRYYPITAHLLKKYFWPCNRYKYKLMNTIKVRFSVNSLAKHPLSGYKNTTNAVLKRPSPWINNLRNSNFMIKLLPFIHIN